MIVNYASIFVRWNQDGQSDLSQRVFYIAYEKIKIKRREENEAYTQAGISGPRIVTGGHSVQWYHKSPGTTCNNILSRLQAPNILKLYR